MLYCIKLSNSNLTFYPFSNEYNLLNVFKNSCEFDLIQFSSYRKLTENMYILRM